MPRTLASFAALATVALALAPAPLARADRIDEVERAVGRMHAQLIAVDGMVRAREEGFSEMRQRILRMSEDVTQLKVPPPLPMAAPFLAGPPPSSDSAGVAKVAVFAPRVEVESTRRHDTVFLKLRRIEADAVKLIGEPEVGQDENGVDLAIDRSGALFVAEWSTTEGHAYNLLLKDGATGQTAASVQVKPLQNQGRLIFVGYKIE